MRGLEAELDAVLAQTVGGHDGVPFMTQMLPASTVRLRLLPPEMLKLLKSSPDYRSVRPGDPPTWFQIAAEDQQAELVVYRAEADGNHYVLSPK